MKLPKQKNWEMLPDHFELQMRIGVEMGYQCDSISQSKVLCKKLDN